MTSSTIIASFDFGPVHTSVCLVEADTTARSITAIREWLLIDWRAVAAAGMSTAEEGGGGYGGLPPPMMPRVTKPIDSLRMPELRDLCTRWHAWGASAPRGGDPPAPHTPALASSSTPDSSSSPARGNEEGTPTAPTKKRRTTKREKAGGLGMMLPPPPPATSATRAQLLKYAKAMRDRFAPKIKQVFFHSYEKYTEMIAAQLNSILRLNVPDARLDAVLFEHQPAHFRYENAVVESMVAQHIYTMTHLPTRTVAPPAMHFLSPAFKFKAFNGIGGTERKQRAPKRKLQHAVNKSFSIECCRAYLARRAETAAAAGSGNLEPAAAVAQFEGWLADGVKSDDLADVLIQIAAFLELGVPKGGAARSL